MSAFPPPGAEIYYNDAGEPLGWDNPGAYEPEYCDYCGGAHGSIACPEDDDLVVDDHWEDE